MMRLFTLIFLSFCLLIANIITPTVVQAEDAFSTSIDSTYTVDTDRSVEVRHEIRIENLTDTQVSKAYELVLSGIKVSRVKAFDNGVEIQTTVEHSDKETKILLHFTEVVAHIGKTRNIVLTYESESYVLASGGVVDIQIPYLANRSSISDSTVKMTVPKDFGNDAYIYPHNYEKQSDQNSKTTYLFTRESLQSRNIRAVFGNSQTYKVNLSYHLSNNSILPKKQIIALPSDTQRQKVIVESLIPEPLQIIVNEDGNWIAEYELSSMEKIDIEASMYIQVFADSLGSPELVSSPANILAHIQPTQYWPSEDPEIQKLAKQLQTPKNIYDYVVTTLHYNHSADLTNRKREGAKAALARPNDAICTEFTDLFITLSRAAGIPAREINGYGYSDNPIGEPLSLVSDVLHSWPEYWDEDAQTWVPVDPTWEKTSGQEYFSQFDMRHLTFVIHGRNPDMPLSPGWYTKAGSDEYEKQISVELAPPLSVEDSYLLITVENQVVDVPFEGNKNFKVKINNNSPEAVTNQTLMIQTDAQEKKEYYISTIPPYGHYELEYSVNYGFAGTKSPRQTLLSVSAASYVIPHSVWDIMGPSLGILGLIVTIVVLVLVLRHFYPRKVKVEW
jgi:transglutaminase-like putative cysteine protease